MKLIRRILLLAISVGMLSYLIDLTGGICQIAMDNPQRPEIRNWQSHARSYASSDTRRKAASRRAMLKSSSLPLESASARPWSSPPAAAVSGHEKFEPAPKLPLPQRARKFQPYVERHSEKFKISSCLIYAVIKAESNFNVMAVSPASAYGLMQLVPETGGRAAYRLVYGSDQIPSREYLEDPDKNIELGAAYLRLTGDFFAGVEDRISREYCQIAAYNTGAGNVLKAFGGGYSQAIARINSLSPSEVYEHLTTNLPYEETRKYLPKVLAFRQEFASL